MDLVINLIIVIREINSLQNHSVLEFHKMETSIDFYRHIYYNINSLKLVGLWFYILHPLNSVWYWVRVLSRIFIGSFAFIIPTGGQIVYLVRLILSGKFNILDVTGM